MNEPLSAEELVRRRPVWRALSDLFLDREITDLDCRAIALTLARSGYSVARARAILWDEVFPAVEFNLRSPAGEWAGFADAWLEARILGGEAHPSPATADEQPRVAAMIEDEWQRVLNAWLAGVE